MDISRKKPVKTDFGNPSMLKEDSKSGQSKNIHGTSSDNHIEIENNTTTKLQKRNASSKKNKIGIMPNNNNKCEKIESFLKSDVKKTKKHTNKTTIISLETTWCNNHLHFDQCESKQQVLVKVCAKNNQVVKNSSLIRSLSGIRSTSIVKYSTIASREVSDIARTINYTKHNGKSFNVISIERVDNPYLRSLFKLKQLEMERQGPVEKRLLYYGASPEQCDMVCRHNFNWRQCVMSRGRCVRGVNFTPMFVHAHYFNRLSATEKTMLLCSVLVGTQHEGYEGLEIPKRGYDTTVRGNGKYIVKYGDDEFYPEYRIRFEVKRSYCK